MHPIWKSSLLLSNNHYHDKNILSFAEELYFYFYDSKKKKKSFTIIADRSTIYISYFISFLFSPLQNRITREYCSFIWDHDIQISSDKKIT